MFLRIEDPKNSSRICLLFIVGRIFKYLLLVRTIYLNKLKLSICLAASLFVLHSLLIRKRSTYPVKPTSSKQLNLGMALLSPSLCHLIIHLQVYIFQYFGMGPVECCPNSVEKIKIQKLKVWDKLELT
jgi:hypothetical protein